MPFQKGHKKIGGRQKGSLNKKRIPKVQEYLSQIDKNPIEEIIKLLPFLETKDQMAAWRDLLSYVHARPKAKEVDETDEPNIDDFEGLTTEDLLKIVDSEGA